MSGIGSLLEQERNLQAYVGSCSETETAPRSEYVGRVLQRHYSQLPLVIALLKECSEHLPVPRRFDALPTGAAAADDTRQLPVLGDAGLLRCLVALHLGLHESIFALSETFRRTGRKSTLLLQAAQMHDEMGWMLGALINESKVVPVAERGANAPPAPVSAWENEGGACLPGQGAGVTARGPSS